MDYELTFDSPNPGDEYDLPPILGSRLISELLKVGAEFYLDGNVIVIESVPGKTAPAVEVKVEEPAPEAGPE